MSWVSSFSAITAICADFFRSIIGAGLGGALADPVKNYPTIFKPNGVFDRFPYLLPNLVCTAVVVFGLVIGILFLEESHEDKRGRKDVGLQIGNKIIRAFHRKTEEPHLAGAQNKEADIVLPQDEKRLSYQSTERSTVSLDIPHSDIENPMSCDEACTIPSTYEKLSWRQGLSVQVILIIIGYGILALYGLNLVE